MSAFNALTHTRVSVCRCVFGGISVCCIIATPQDALMDSETMKRPVCPSVRPSVRPSVCLSVWLTVCLSVCLSVRLSDSQPEYFLVPQLCLSGWRGSGVVTEDSLSANTSRRCFLIASWRKRSNLRSCPITCECERPNRPTGIICQRNISITAERKWYRTR